MPANAYAIVGQHTAVPHDPGPCEVTTPEIALARGPFTASDDRHDHFIHRDGEVFAGTHLIVDFFGAAGLDNLERMERGMRAAVEAAACERTVGRAPLERARLASERGRCGALGTLGGLVEERARL